MHASHEGAQVFINGSAVITQTSLSTALASMLSTMNEALQDRDNTIAQFSDILETTRSLALSLNQSSALELAYVCVLSECAVFVGGCICSSYSW